MMLRGRIFREGTGWSAHCDAVGVYTQGLTREEAIVNLTNGVELQANRTGMIITIAELGGESVLVTANQPQLLAAEVLKHQREVRGLTLADVAKRLKTKSKSINAYAAYEQGTRDPSLTKYRDLLAAVAPEMVLMIEDRKPAKAAKSTAPRTSKAKEKR